MGTLAEYVAGKFGGHTTVRRNPGDTSITTSASEVAKNNPQRIQLVIVNLGSSRIFVDSHEGVSSTQGVPLDPGGSMVLIAEEDGEDVGRDWWAVASTGTQTVFVKETVLLEAERSS